MNVRDFGRYLAKKSVSRLLHQARDESLHRLPAKLGPRTLRSKRSRPRVGTG